MSPTTISLNSSCICSSEIKQLVLSQQIQQGKQQMMESPQWLSADRATSCAVSDNPSAGLRGAFTLTEQAGVSGQRLIKEKLFTFNTIRLTFKGSPSGAF